MVVTDCEAIKYMSIKEYTVEPIYADSCNAFDNILSEAHQFHGKLTLSCIFFSENKFYTKLK